LFLVVTLGKGKKSVVYPLDVYLSPVTLEVLRALEKEGQLYASKLGKLRGVTQAAAARNLIDLEKQGWTCLRAVEGLNRYFVLDEPRITMMLLSRLHARRFHGNQLDQKELGRVFNDPAFRKFVYDVFTESLRNGEPGESLQSLLERCEWEIIDLARIHAVLPPSVKAKGALALFDDLYVREAKRWQVEMRARMKEIDQDAAEGKK
jgi:hypothetical protein